MLDDNAEIVEGTETADFTVSEQNTVLRPECEGVYFTIYPAAEAIMSLTIQEPMLGQRLTDEQRNTPIEKSIILTAGLAARKNRAKDTAEKVVAATSED